MLNGLGRFQPAMRDTAWVGSDIEGDAAMVLKCALCFGKHRQQSGLSPLPRGPGRLTNSFLLEGFPGRPLPSVRLQQTRPDWDDDG